MSNEPAFFLFHIAVNGIVRLLASLFAVCVSLLILLLRCVSIPLPFSLPFRLVLGVWHRLRLCHPFTKYSLTPPP